MENLKKLTEKLFGYYLLFQTIFAIIYEIIINIIPDSISFIHIGIIMIISKIIIELLSWYLARNSAIKSKKLKEADIKLLMKKMYGFAIGVCLVSILLNFQDIKTEIDNITNSDELKMYNTYAKAYLSEEEFEIYNNELNKKIDETKKEIYTSCLVIYSLLVVCTVFSVRMQKKPLLKLVEDELEEVKDDIICN